MWNGYRHGLRQTDLELAEVFSSLQAAGHADDTIVLVMGDHGYEFNEFGLGYYGHASNYGRFQLRTPLYIRWPGRAPRVWTHRTSHLELPATLLTELFGCGNAPRDYSIGRDLFTGRSWDWILAGSYHSHAIVEPGRVIVTEPGGLLQVLGPDLQPARDDRLDPARIEASLLEMRRFYR
jgi:membrane-anchored protein YejM (alkaline phosphatase superfamily)